MTDETALAVAGRAPGPTTTATAPEDRGRLEIAEQVVERVAAIAACEVPGVRRVGSGLESVVGRRYPKVRAQVAGGHVRVRVDVAVGWPAPLARTAAAVRTRVRERLSALVGLTVDVVDVTVATVEVPTRDDRRVQ